MDDRTLGRLVGWYEGLAGAAGVILTAVVAPALVRQTQPQYRWQASALFLAMAGVFAVVALAGVLLLRGGPWGRRLSVAVQLAQIPLWAVGPTRWVFFAGAYLAPVVREDGASLVFGLKSNLELAWGGAREVPALIGFNVVPLIVLWLLARRAPARTAAPAGDAAPAA